MDNDKININDVLKFIRDKGFVYLDELREELDKVETENLKIARKDIQENKSLYERLSDM